MQSTYGIVELRTGEVRMFSPDQIQFLDNKSAEYVFLKTDQTIWQAVTVLRAELLKHGDLYNGFRDIIQSVLKPNERYVGDGEFEIRAEFGSYYLAEEILNRVIGEE